MNTFKATLDTRHQNGVIGTVTQFDNAVFEVQIVTDGQVGVAWDSPQFELLAMKRDANAVREVEQDKFTILSKEDHKVQIELKEQFLTCRGIVKMQLIIKEGNRLSTTLFYLSIGQSLDHDIIDSHRDVAVLDELETYIKQGFDDLAYQEQRMEAVEQSTNDLNDTMNANEAKRNKAETIRQEAFDTNEANRTRTFNSQVEEQKTAFSNSQTQRDESFNQSQQNMTQEFEASQRARDGEFGASQKSNQNTFSDNEEKRQQDFEIAEFKRQKNENNRLLEEERRRVEFDETIRSAKDAIEKAEELIPRQDNLEKTFERLIIDAGNSNSEIVSARVDNSTGQVYRTIGERLDRTNAQLSKIKTFDIFPSDEVLNKLPMNSTFEVKGFYEEGDMPKCLYKKVSWGANSIDKSSYHIKPIVENTNMVFLPNLGIRTGAEYAESNSRILSQVYFGFGSTLVLPVGDFYFDRPIDLKSKQLSLTGEVSAFTTDLNAKGFTWLYFMNLRDGECAVSLATGTISNVIIKGNENQYNYKIDRTKTYVDSANIEQENYTVKCYGIKGGSTSSLINVYVANFYYGCYLDTGNIYITDFYARNCHIGLSIGNDTKCKGVYGWDLHTMLQIRGSISSAVQVRCDSCHHLVHLVGYMSGNILTDLDADYCLGSVIKIGNYDEWGSVENLVVNGVVGRHCCLNVYDINNDVPPTTSNIASDSNISDWAFISVERKNNLNGAIITMAHSLHSNPLDSSSSYRTPAILIAGGESSSIIASFNTNFKNHYGSDGDINFNRQSMLDSIVNFSGIANNTRVAFNTPTGNYYYLKLNPSTIITTKGTQEELN